MRINSSVLAMGLIMCAGLVIFIWTICKLHGKSTTQGNEKLQPRPAEWIGQSNLLLNRPARRVLAHLLPSADTTIHLTAGSKSMGDFILNWKIHLDSAGMKPTVVAAADDDLLETCERWNIAAVRMKSSNSTTFRAAAGYVRHRTTDFVRYGTFKIAILLAFLAPGFSILFSDLDVLWLGGREWERWMLPAAAAPQALLLAHADIIVSTDELSLDEDTADLSHGPGDQGWLSFGMRAELNTGILFLRGGSKGSLAFANAWCAAMENAMAHSIPTHDQLEFHRLVHGSPTGLASVMKRQHAYDAFLATIEERRVGTHRTQLEAPQFRHSISASLRDVFLGTVPQSGSAPPAPFFVGTLPARLFVTGHAWFSQSQWKHAEALHLTFGFGDGVAYPYGKRQRAREAGLWLVDPVERFGDGAAGDEVFLRLIGPLFSEPQRIAIEQAYPEHSPQRHIHLDGLQRAVVRDLLALAEALNATLIMPTLLCACDRYWGLLNNCRHPLATPVMRLPYSCAQDVAFDVAKWYEAGLRFRESSFLEHPNASKSIMARSVRVFAREGGGSAEPGTLEAASHLAVPRGTPFKELLPRALATNPRMRLVEIGRMDLAGLCAHAPATWSQRIRGLLHNPTSYCPAEANPNFPGWQGWDLKRPPLNCSRGQVAPSDLPEACERIW